MLRHTSPVERVLTYATFLAISLAIHMLVILGEGRAWVWQADGAKRGPTRAEGRP